MRRRVRIATLLTVILFPFGAQSQTPPTTTIPTQVDLLSQQIANYAKENASLVTEVLTLRQQIEDLKSKPPELVPSIKK